MALLRDDMDIRALLRLLRLEVAQNRTDIQRLWRLVSRQTHEPFFVIGGDAAESSAGGPEFPPPPDMPPDDNTTPPGGGPESPLGEDCCLWIWDGMVWQLAQDNTSGCECPLPDAPGSAIGETHITCCPASSASGSGTLHDCFGCEIPNTIHVSITQLVGPNEPLMENLLGSHALTWDGSAWMSGCIELAEDAGWETARIRAVCFNTTCKLLLGVLLYAGEECDVLLAAFTTGCVTFECEPLLQVDEVTVIGSDYRFVVTE